jgi:hypothetical protein
LLSSLAHRIHDGRWLAVSFGGGMIADARVLSAFHRLTTGTFTNALEG